MDWNNFFGLEKRDLNETISYVTGANGNGITDYTQYGASNIAAFFECMELITNGIAALPVQIKKKTSKQKTSILKNHPVNLLFSDKHNRLTKFTFIKMIVQSVIIKGNGFAYIQRAQDGTPVKLKFIEAGDVTIHYNKNTDELYYSATAIVKKLKIMPEDMLHFIMHSYNGIQGISILNYARRSLMIAGNTENTANAYFNQGGTVSAVIKVHNNISKQARQDILTEWNKTYSNGGKGLCVIGQNMDYQPVTLSAAEKQMLESREYNCADICRFMGVHPAMLGLKGYARLNKLEEVQQEFLTQTLMPYILMIEQELDKKLLRENENNVKIVLDTEAYLRSTKEALASYLTTLHQNAIMSTNECRQILGLPEIEGGDEVLALYSDINQNAINNKDNAEGDKTNNTDKKEEKDGNQTDNQ